MKIKKTYILFVCHLTLLAFISIICLEVSANESFSHTKTEFSSTKNVILNNLNFIFEEEQDNNDIYHSLLLFPFVLGITLIEITLSIKKLKKLFDCCVHYFLINNKLFINYRVLRL